MKKIDPARGHEEVTRRNFIKAGACATVAAGLMPVLNRQPTAIAAQPTRPFQKPSTRLVPPANGKIPVAFVAGRSTEAIDYAGPWIVFESVLDFSRGKSMNMDDAEVFRLYSVSDSTNPIRASGGMKIIPDYTFADAPQPKVLVVPGTNRNPEMLDWIRKMTPQCDVVMSVCVGVYHLAEAGLLGGKNATINPGAYPDIQRKYPDVHFLLNKRWVQSDSSIFTSGPTGAGIDLALHVVELYLGRDAAARAALTMNYPGHDWKGDGTESVKSPLPSAQFSTGVLGEWQGKVITKDGPLQLALHIWPTQNGKVLVGTADLLNRDERDLFIDPIAFTAPDLHFEIRPIKSAYDGKLNAQASTIEGTWKQDGASAPLVLNRVSVARP